MVKYVVTLAKSGVAFYYKIDNNGKKTRVKASDVPSNIGPTPGAVKKALKELAEIKKASSKNISQKSKCTKRNPIPPCASGYSIKKNKKGDDCCYKDKSKKKTKSKTKKTKSKK